MVKQFPQLANLQGTPQKVVQELQAGKVLRAAYAERQLDEVMADFWFNHFNVFARKGPVEFMVGDYERAIRERSSRSQVMPAMLGIVCRISSKTSETWP